MSALLEDVLELDVLLVEVSLETTLAEVSVLLLVPLTAVIMLVVALVADVSVDNDVLVRVELELTAVVVV